MARLRWWCSFTLALVVSACATTSPSATSTVATETARLSASTPSATSTASTRPSGSFTVALARIADLGFLKERLLAIHPNPFLDDGEAAFDARVAAIEQRMASLTDVGYLVAVMDLMGHRERDGHSGAWAFAQPSALVDAWPVWLWDFPDGPRIVAAQAPYEDLVGARVVKVGH